MCRIRKSIIFGMFVLVLVLVMPATLQKTNAEAAYLNYKALRMTQGATMKLQMVGTSKKVKWNSSNKKVATVKKGKVKAVKAGNCTVTAKVRGKKYKCKVTVKNDPNYIPEKKPFTKITLNVTSLKLNVLKVAYSSNGKAKLGKDKATYDLKLLNTTTTPEWKTSNENVATVSNGTITAVAEGKCTISAVIGKNSYKCTVIVSDLKEAEEIALQENVYKMLALINIDRVKVKSAPLKIKEELNQVAEIRAKEGQKKFSHTRPDGTLYKTAYADVGFKQGRIIGENLAYTRDKVEYMDNFIKATYDRLYKSKYHRENMLDRRFEYVGIGYVNVGTSLDEFHALCAETYWAQEFYTK